MTNQFRSSFIPNTPIPVAAERFIAATYGVLTLLAWATFPSKLIPGPIGSIGALPHLWREGLGVELFTSLTLNLQAVSIMTVVSLIVAYGTALPALRPLAIGFSFARFNSFIGLSLILTLFIGDPHWIKVILLVIGMSVFTVPSLVAMIESIPAESYDHARTLHMNEWRVLWEVVVLGQIHEVLDILRTNCAMGWMLLPEVEGLFRTEGGVGVLLLTENKYFKLEDVYGIVFLFCVFGLMQDAALQFIKRVLCPYAFINMERSA